MQIIPQPILDYAEKYSEKEPIILQDLRRETWQKVLAPRMLSGHLQGRLIAMISKIIQPKIVLEIGTYTGYATLCLAEGLAENGMIHTIDNNEELIDIQKKYFKKAGLEKKITRHIGEALDILPKIACGYDLVFIDADKVNYSNYFDFVIDQVNIGGIVLSDNVLWGGKVLQKPNKNDKETNAIIAFNNKVKKDKRVETLLLPIRDGICLLRKV